MSNLTVLKIGGNVIDSPDALKRFLTDFTRLPGAKILIHGGGKIATQIAEKLGIETTMIDGRRITDRAMLDVVTMVYGGLVNKQIVAQLQALNVNAIGLTGADAGTVLARKRAVGAIDYGFAGDIIEVDSGQIQFFLRQNLTPVFAPLTYDEAGNLLNTNADTMASAIAADMVHRDTVTLVYCFEKRGVLSDPNDDDSVVTELTPALYADHKAIGTISKGMIPKLDNAFLALEKGVSRVIICHANEVTDAVAGRAGTVLTL
ncbi:MAG: acetylglutamate kinase [Bacteroidetes bacterium]|nr:acetylglutamate kinase [Fibrella sp.]